MEQAKQQTTATCVQSRFVKPGQGATFGQIRDLLSDYFGGDLRTVDFPHLAGLPHDHKSNLALTGQPLTAEDIENIRRAR